MWNASDALGVRIKEAVCKLQFAYRNEEPSVVIQRVEILQLCLLELLREMEKEVRRVSKQVG